jgi:hypothetical protein
MSTATPMATATPVIVESGDTVWNSTSVTNIFEEIYHILNADQFEMRVNVPLVDLGGNRYMLPSPIFNNYAQISVAHGLSAQLIEQKSLHYVIEQDGYVVRLLEPVYISDPFTGKPINPNVYATYVTYRHSYKH